MKAFCLVFVECITAVENVAAQQFWVFDCDLKFKVGIASHETIRFLTLRQLMIAKIQRSWRQMRDVTVICNFQAGL